MRGTLGGRTNVSRMAAPIAALPKLGVGEVGTLPCPDGAWTTKTSAAFTGVDAGAFAGYAWFTFNDGSNRFAAYNPVGNSWATKATPPMGISARGGLAAAGVLNDVVAFYTTGAGVAKTAYYTESGDVWDSGLLRAAMPTPRQGFAICIAGGTGGSGAHLIGGDTPPSFTPSTKHEKYNRATDTWTTHAALPTAVDYGAACCPTTGPGAGDIYLWEGDSGSGRGWRWSVAGDSWSSLPTLPTPIDQPLVATVSNGNIIIGGDPTNTFWIFDTTTETYFATDSSTSSELDAWAFDSSGNVYAVDFTTKVTEKFTC